MSVSKVADTRQIGNALTDDNMICNTKKIKKGMGAGLACLTASALEPQG